MDERRESMFDIVEGVFLLGLGAASLTKEKVERSVDDLIARGRLSREEGRRLAADLTERGEREKAAMSETLRDEVRKAVGGADIATKEDVRRLESEIAEIRSRLGMGPAEPVETDMAPGREEPEAGRPPELTDTER